MATLEERVSRLEAVIETAVPHLVTKEDIARLQGSFTTMNRMLAIGAPLLVGAMIAAIKFL